MITYGRKLRDMRLELHRFLALTDADHRGIYLPPFLISSWNTSCSLWSASTDVWLASDSSTLNLQQLVAIRDRVVDIVRFFETVLNEHRCPHWCADPDFSGGVVDIF
jgi:hypothetical protein